MIEILNFGKIYFINLTHFRNINLLLTKKFKPVWFFKKLKIKTFTKKNILINN